MIGIYKITNNVNGKCYIGQAVDIESRWRKHHTAPFNPNDKSYNYPLYRAIRKYGIENFKFEVLEECPRELLNEREIFYITKYNAYEDGYNQTEGGNANTHNYKLTCDDVTDIIHRLKTTLDNTKVIASDFGVGFTTIRGINVGEIYHRDGETYPIRPGIYLLEPTESGYQLKQRLGMPIEKTNNKSELDKAAQKKHRNVYAKSYKCPDCGAQVVAKGNRCINCSRIASRKVERPNVTDLAKMIVESSFVQVGKRFGVDGNAVKKWCKDYGIPFHKKELVDWYNQQFNTLSEDVIKKTTYNAKKPVKQINMETGEVLAIFESIGAAGKALDKNNSYKISEVCKGIRKSAYGYFWQYADQDAA